MTDSTADRAKACLPLHPLEFHVLVTLLRERMHGYAIVKQIESRDAGFERIFPANLYRRIRKLRDLGLLRDSGVDESGSGPPRRYFELTELGREVVRLETARMRTMVELASDAEDERFGWAGDSGASS